MIKDFIPDRKGWYKNTPSGRIYLFLEEALIEASGGLPLERILEILEQAGALVQTDPGQKYKSTLCPDGLVRKLYWIDKQKLENPRSS